MKKIDFQNKTNPPTASHPRINATNLNALQNNVYEVIYHKIGESITISGYFIGRLRDAQKLIEFTITTPKLLKDIPINNISISGNVVITHSSGTYITNGVTEITDLGTITKGYKTDNRISFTIHLNEPPTNLQNNALVMIVLDNCTLSF